MPSSLLPGTSTMPLLHPRFQLSANMSPAVPEEIKHWTFFMPTLRRHIHHPPLPPLGRSDHDLIHLLPLYQPLVHRQPAVTHTRQIWSEESLETLQDCFETTMWDVFCEDYGDDIDGLTSCVTDYINFCVDSTIPTKTVRVFANSKPWITPEIKDLLRDKRRVFKSGDRDLLKTVQRDLRKKIREGKSNYRRRMEDQLQRDDISGVWRSLNTISGRSNSRPALDRDQEWVNDLNRFFNRFEQTSTPPPTHPALLQLPPTGASSAPRTLTSTPPPATPPPRPPSPFSTPPNPPTIPPAAHPTPPTTPPPSMVLSTAQVERGLARLKVKKATGPDGITSRLLRSCSGQLCGIVEHIFNMSLRLHRVPQLWKTSCVVPVPKSSRPSDFNHYRPVALTSHLAKTLERLVLHHLRPLVSSSADPLQFAYRPSIGVEDAVIFLMQRSLAHLERGWKHCEDHVL
ncbi:uncharacterized protein ACBT44_011751 isoform 1-T1 [Syngnathus typhle]